jgi:hypothetical protein
MLQKCWRAGDTDEQTKQQQCQQSALSRPTCVTRSLVHDVITLLIIFLRFKIGPNKFHNR